MRIVTTHKNTDFDALASLIAATIIYPGALPVLPRSVNANVRAFLSIHKDLFDIHAADEIDFKRVDTLVVVDTNSWRRLERMDTLRKKKNLDIRIWDHHESTGDIACSWKTQEAMGANITLMIRGLKRERKLITPIQATLFLAGLYEDTGNLMFPATTAEDALAAAYLLERKADLHVLGSLLRPAYGEKQKDILYAMLKNAERKNLNGYTVSINALDIDGHVGNLSVVVNMYREIINVDAAFGIFVNTDNRRSIVIGRSNVDGLDVGSIMNALGGGGHPGAGSALIKNGRSDVIAQMIRDLIEGNQQTSVQVSDLMSFPVFSVTPDIKMKEVARILREKGCTGIPVIVHEKLVGVISRRDFRKLQKESQLEAPVKAFMSTNVRTVSAGKSPIQAARLMVKYDVGRLPVVEDGKMIGILTRSDAMRYFYDLLPD